MIEIERMSEENAEACFVLPAMRVNRVYVHIDNSLTVRLAFFDQRSADSPLHPRASIDMSMPDIVNMRDLLSNMIDSIESGRAVMGTIQ